MFSATVPKINAELGFSNLNPARRILRILQFLLPSLPRRGRASQTLNLVASKWLERLPLSKDVPILRSVTLIVYRSCRKQCNGCTKKQPAEARLCGCICSASYFSFQNRKYIPLMEYLPADCVGVHGLWGPVRKRQDAKEVPLNKEGTAVSQKRSGGCPDSRAKTTRLDNPTSTQSFGCG